MKYKIILILFILPLLSFSNPIKRGKYKKTKTINKEYPVNENTLINIKNRYGNLDVTTTETDKITFKIEITVSGNDEEKVEDKLDAITVDFDASSNEVSAKTIIHKSKSKSWFSWSYNNNLNYKINYKVTMPIENEVSFYNDYGNIYLNELDGKASINCDYGKIVLGTLNHTNNTINIDYCSSSTIEYMNGGKINADYSKLSVETAKKVDLNADYTSTNFEYIENLKYNCDYGSITCENVNNISGEGDYLSMKFGKIYKKAIISSSYGSIRINELYKSFSKLNIDADYTGIKIGIDSNDSFNIKADLSYAGLSIEDKSDFTFNIKRAKTTSKYYEGYFNNTNSDASISIESNYGGVKLFTY